MEPPTLHTARLKLSAPRKDDVAAVHAECQDAAIQRFTTVPSPYLRSDAETFVELTRTWWAEGSEATWAIRLDGLLVGMIGLAKLASGGPEIGYWVSSRVRGRGVASEAARAVVEWAFAPDCPSIERIEWRAVVGNVGSARVARSVGFRYEGLLRRAHVNSLGRADVWIGGLLRDDERTPVPWPALGSGARPVADIGGA
ncbi:Protein N-acetyltransferase, RimJ/RimL family [Microbacterium sp. ru370.1]|uniref:GNAT family N-acetyltransferase n=1 Tax=unclassified Microbacterium TaxID=2609290 RepID=UPI00087F574D|nr:MULTISPECIES: GNAT family protein [unclassified Microbacterium]SDO51247.1 Protein N-acetyltransferase, RimJ/RimL family [Microbacterium sp. ru370.1]SIT83402.1 Protein N-acetyltransferase, RimJ/RimL family [Microbacterium sp. RU1D]